MGKTWLYGWEVFKISWKANGIFAVVTLLSKVYESTLYPLIQIILIARVLDLLQQNKVKGIQDLLNIAIFFLIASILKIVLTTFLDVKQVYYDTRIDAWIDLSICKKLTELDPATFEDSSFQNLLAQIEGVKGAMQAQLMRFIALVDTVVKIVTATLIIWRVFPWFTFLLLLAAIPLYTYWDKFRADTWPFYVEKRSILTRLSQYIKNLLSADSTSKESAIFGTGPVLLSKIKSQQTKYFHEFNKSLTFGYTSITLSRIFHFLVFLFTQYINLQAVIKGVLTIGQFALYFQQTLTLTTSSEEVLNQHSSISVRNKYLEKYFDLIKTQPKITSVQTPTLMPQPIPPQIEFKNVTFIYPGTTRKILENFNLTIKPGEKVALVGENGAGKTTIIKLLLRFYDVSDGEIFINGVNIRELNLSQWHQLVGALFQDFIRYQFTFRENIVFGDLTKNENEEKLLKEAIFKSGADQYLKNLPKQFDQMLGKMFEGGIDLSGGQWQKLALARAFFRDAPILILDEPTSAIDAKAEAEIFEKVQKLQQDKTVIIISHRFSTVRNADRILVLEGGKIFEEGTHQQLMKENGLYAELFNIQAKGYQ